MKNNFLRTICVAALLIPFLWSCQRESIVEDSNVAPEIAGVIIEPIDGVCSPAKTVSLVTAGLDSFPDLCLIQGVVTPCQTTTPWGTVTYTKYTNSNYPNSTLNLEVSLAPGWFATGYSVIVTPPGPIQTNGIVPVVTNSWTSDVISPLRNQFMVDVDLLGTLYGAGCFDWSIVVNVQKISLIGLPVPGTQRTLYAYDPNGAGSPLVIDDCYESCPLPETTSSQGSCQGCRAAVNVTYSGCAAVTVSSCKPIRQVVVVYSDCSREYHDNLNVSSVTYSAASAGKVISHVFVRSGCRGNTAPPAQDNIDTNGFNYNNIRRFQFDSPCRNPSCN